MTTNYAVSTVEKAQRMIKAGLELLDKLTAQVSEPGEVVDAVASVEASETDSKTVEAVNGEVEHKEEGINRSEKIREYFSKHGMSVRNKDVVDYIKKTYNTEVGPAHVSIIRNKMTKAKTSKLSKATPKKVEAKTKTEVRSSKKTSASSLPMHSVCTNLLKKHNAKGGLKLSELTDLVIKSGYSYKGDKGRDGVLQNVYQALHSLAKEGSHAGYKGETPVVVKDPLSKRYRINPKAKVA